MLKAALCGNYVNFGVFRLYGDDALDEALKTFVKLLVSIELKNLLVSFSLSLSLFSLFSLFLHPTPSLSRSLSLSLSLSSFIHQGPFYSRTTPS